MKGNHIRIIHTISRDLNEMMEALAKWLPLYMTGAIFPLYYNRIRDNLYQRTLFIAPKLAAICSSCVGGANDKTVNFYIDTEDAVDALEEEFRTFDALCLPLMKIYRPDKCNQIIQQLSIIGVSQGNVLSAQSALSLATMPDNVISSVCKRGGDALQVLCKESKKSFQQALDNSSVTEFITIPDAKDVIEGRINIKMGILVGVSDVFYTKDEYLAHLQNILKLCKEYTNYHICLSSNLPDNMLVLFKDKASVLLARLDDYPIVFTIDEYHIMSAIREYLLRQVEETKNMDNSIKQLTKLIDMLKD